MDNSYSANGTVLDPFILWREKGNRTLHVPLVKKEEILGFYWNSHFVSLSSTVIQNLNRKGSFENCWVRIECNPEELIFFGLTKSGVLNSVLSIEKVNTRFFGRTNRLPRDASWFNFLKSSRKIMESMGLEEVFTASLVVSPGIEPHLEPLMTTLYQGTHSWVRYLPTSPEYQLKKLLADGWRHIFEIKSSFRNNENSPLHSNEFTMLEWYRVDCSLSQIQEDLWSFIQKHMEKFPCSQSLTLQRNRPFVIVTVAEAFFYYTKKKLTPQTTKEELTEWCFEFNIQTHLSDSWDDLYFRIFLDKVEPFLLKDHPFLILKDYPPSQSALASLNEQSGWTNRFEFYWDGIEIANAYDELLDSEKVSGRFKESLSMRKEKGWPDLPLDIDLLQALQEPLPQTSGIALGLERLYMALCGYRKLSQVKN